jgi:hypothetical protein
MLKQLELLSLILLRDAFKTFGKIRHPIDWSGDISQILYMVADSFGAIMIFLFIIFIGRMMRQHVFVGSGENQYHFIAIKKSISIIMILVFIIFGIDHLFFFQFAPCSTNFYETFYTILIFSDILLVLVSLRYFTNYLVVFRNSAFTLATVFIRLALTAPPYINIALGMAASLFVFGLVYFYNKFYPQQEGLPDK